MATAKEWDDTSPPCRDERLASPRDVLLHLMLRPLPTTDWETTQRGTAPVYKKPVSVRATSVKDGASCELQPDWSTPVHWQPTCSRRDHRLRSTLSCSSG